MMNMNRSSVYLTRWHVLAIALLIGLGTYKYLKADEKKEVSEAVGITGVHHLGGNFQISEFYVNGYYGSNIGRGGGGGRNVCCVMLPRRWRPGLSVEVRWSLDDWSKENVAETDAGNYESVLFVGAYKAQVPVERYESAERLYVHFFSGGKVRVVSGLFDPLSPMHPGQKADPRAADTATQGERVAAIFSDAELAEMDRKRAERKRKYGDWR